MVRSVLKEKKIRVFAFSFLMAIVVWLMINLSKTYSKTIPVVLKLVNTQKGYHFPNTTDTLQVTITGTGFGLLKNKLTHLYYEIDAQQVEGKWLWDSDNQSFSGLFSSGLQVTQVVPNFFEIRKLKLHEKKLKINSNLKVHTRSGYGISQLEIVPQETLVYGSEELLATLNEIETDSKVLHDLHQPFSLQLALRSKKELNVTIDSVLVKGKVEQFTQQEFLIPITVKNKPLNADISIFPKEVRVQFQVPLSKYDELSMNHFQVSVDASESTSSNLLRISTDTYPAYISQVRLLTNAVNYILIEQ